MKTAGIYIHIPFCKNKCNYCDYYCLEKRGHDMEVFIKMLQREIELTADSHDKDWLFDTIYFGGGSPALLSPKELNSILDLLKNQFNTTITHKENELRDDPKWEEVKAKIAEIQRKKALQHSSTRACETEKVITDASVKEIRRNIKRMKLKNMELQDRIDHERDGISWLDRLKGKSKPFKPSRKYTLGIDDTSVREEDEDEYEDEYEDEDEDEYEDEDEG